MTPVFHDTALPDINLSGFRNASKAWKNRGFLVSSLQDQPKARLKTSVWTAVRQDERPRNRFTGKDLLHEISPLDQFYLSGWRIPAKGRRWRAILGGSHWRKYQAKAQNAERFQFSSDQNLRARLLRPEDVPLHWPRHSLCRPGNEAPAYTSYQSSGQACRG